MTSASPPGSVLLAASGDLWAGAAVQVCEVARELAGRPGCSVTVALLNPGRLELTLRDAGLDVRVLDERKNSVPGLVRATRRLLAGLRPDILHLNDYKFQVVASAAWLALRDRPPIVRTVHSRPSRWAGWAGSRVALFQRLDDVSLRRLTARVIAVSLDLERELTRTVGRDRVRVVHNGIALAQAKAPPPEAVRASFGIPRDVAWIGTGIRLEEIKDPALLVEAAARLAASGVRFTLSIFGEGRLRKPLEELIDARGLRGSVILHGHHDDLTSVMGAWDVFAMSSRHEGLPMVLLEAMARGVPPVCTRVGGIVEIVEDGASGLLVPPADAAALAAALRSLCEDRGRRAAVGRAAASRIRAEFSIGSTVDRYLSIYREILDGRARRSPVPAAAR